MLLGLAFFVSVMSENKDESLSRLMVGVGVLLIVIGVSIEGW